MRHPHGLRAAAKAAINLPAIGSSYGGGFFAGAISHTANGVATHLLIVAPAATGATGTGYTLTTDLQWKIIANLTAGTFNFFDGAANTATMVAAGIALHPAAQFCVGLSIGGYSDWYLPARDELDIAYQNLKPTTTSNNTSAGVNPYSVPARTVTRTAGAPAQTTVAAFQSGGAQAFVADLHWSSTQDAGTTRSWRLSFNDGSVVGLNKATLIRVRAFRKVAV
jgi:hypothetical protein